MSEDDKKPLVGGESAPPPPPYIPSSGYQQADGTAPVYPMPQPPPPAYGHPQQPTAYGTTTNITVVQASPVARGRILVEVKPPNHVVMSVVVLLIFCWVFGLIALFMGLQVDSAWAAGDRDRARRLSASARGWNLSGMIVGTVVYIVIIISSLTPVYSY